MDGEDIELTYRDIDGPWVDDSAYGVVHKIASDRSKKGSCEAAEPCVIIRKCQKVLLTLSS